MGRIGSSEADSSSLSEGELLLSWYPCSHWYKQGCQIRGKFFKNFPHYSRTLRRRRVRVLTYETSGAAWVAGGSRENCPESGDPASNLATLYSYLRNKLLNEFSCSSTDGRSVDSLILEYNRK